MESLWQYSTVHNSACKVIEEQTLWGQTVCRVWLPNQDAVVRVPRCAAEENEWRHELQSAWQIVPEIRSLLALRVRSAECEVRS